MFRRDERLGIDLPDFTVPFEQLDVTDQEDVLIRWETVRARIPEQIMRFENVIEDLLAAVHEEEDWDVIAMHFAEISDYASRINELNTWRRVDQGLHVKGSDDHLSEEHRSREK